MMQEVLIRDALYQRVFEAIPIPVLIVDDDVRILGYNRAAAPLLGDKPESVLRQRAGEVLHCIHAYEAPGGCGRAEFCRQCIIRASVGRAFLGQTTSRTHTKMALESGEETTQFHLLITASPLPDHEREMAILLLEDVSELVALRGMLPICAGCKKIRDDTDYWHDVADYFGEHLAVEFTHGLCPECVAKARAQIGTS